MTDQAEQESAFPVNTENEFAINFGENLPNHSSSMNGRGKYIQLGRPVRALRTQQEIYRLCCHLLSLAILLPNEDGSHSYEDVEAAIRNC